MSRPWAGRYSALPMVDGPVYCSKRVMGSLPMLACLAVEVHLQWQMSK